ncbi:MAG: V-type ATPase subunit [Treponema sp.]|nr:V-type ATPase subunit [Treponema sp.]
MIRQGEKAYAFVKASGIIGKSFVSRRIAALNPINRLSELDQLVFGSNARELPERELLPDLERRLSGRGVDAISAVLKSYKKPPLLFLLLLQVYEYSDLKTALALIVEGETSSKPVFTPLGRFGAVNFDAWPDAEAMLKQTDLQFILAYLEQSKSPAVPSGTGEDESGEVSLETALDRHYYAKLWTSLTLLKRHDRIAAEKIIAEEIALRNCAWALRLRSYYSMKAEEVKQHLVFIEKNNKLCEDALAALEFSLDDYSEWEKWKRFRFLNPVSGHWKPDPRYFQNAASEHLYHLALRSFRTSLSYIDKVFCFIKLKQFEEDVLTSCTEGLGMGMTCKDVLAALELGS